MQTPSFLPDMEHCYVPASSGVKRKAAGSGHVVHSQAASRALHEYQFLPEQPSVRSETYERLPQTHFYDPAAIPPSTRVSALSGGQYLHGNEQVDAAYAFQGQLSSTSIFPKQGRQQVFSSGQEEYENASQSNSFTHNDEQFGMHQVLGSENPYLSVDRRMMLDEDPSQVERKHKVCQYLTCFCFSLFQYLSVVLIGQSEETRIHKEVEAHEKRIRKELEKQDILRRKV